MSQKREPEDRWDATFRCWSWWYDPRNGRYFVISDRIFDAAGKLTHVWLLEQERESAIQIKLQDMINYMQEDLLVIKSAMAP